MNGRFSAVSLACADRASGWSWRARMGGSLGWPSVAVVDGQVGLGDLELEQVGAAGELQGGWLGADASAGGQDVGDVLGAEGRKLQTVVDGAGDGLAAVYLGQGEDLTQVHTRVHALGLQALAVGLGARR